VGRAVGATTEGEALDAVFVATEGEAFVKGGGFLPAAGADVPAGIGRLDFVEASFVGVFDGEQLDVVGPTQGEGRFPRHRFGNPARHKFAKRCLLFLSEWQLVRHRLTHSRTVFDEELPHELEVGHRETGAEFVGKSCRQRFEYFSPFCSCSTMRRPISKFVSTCNVSTTDATPRRADWIRLRTSVMSGARWSGAGFALAAAARLVVAGFFFIGSAAPEGKDEE
jgi:hypothetical protein